ncbi:hypothetical protein GCM10009736_09400 [Actinomadura bangladeshensis]
MTEDVRVDIAGHIAVVEFRRPPENFFDTSGAEFSRPNHRKALLDDSSELYSRALRLFRCQTPVVRHLSDPPGRRRTAKSA